MKEILIQEYNNLSKLLIKPKPQSNFYHINFINGAKLEITGKIDKKYNIQFYDQNTLELLFESEITNNMWTKFNKTYYINYNIKVIDLENNTVVFEHKFNAKNKRVYIHFASKALGDTIAWFPFAEEFRKKHQCELIVSTFHNSMFKENYPNIKFITPGEEQFDLYAMYEVGWHYNEDNTINTDCNPQDFKKYSLQECSADILGITCRMGTEQTFFIHVPSDGKF